MKYLYIVLLALLVVTACDDNSLPEVKPLDAGTWIDPDNGIAYNWVRIGEQEWMTSNLRAGIPYYDASYDLSQYGSNLYLDFSSSKEKEKQDMEENGNLYEWGTACKVCANLKDGWRLPTDEDWKKLEIALGMSVGEANTLGWRGDGVATLMQQQDNDGSGLNFIMSGCWIVGDSHYMRIRYVQEKGFYWTASRDNDGRVFYRKFHYNSSEVYRNTTDTLTVPAMRVRCVRDVK